MLVGEDTVHSKETIELNTKIKQCILLCVKILGKEHNLEKK